MSEGGKNPWKRQSTKSFARAPDYQRLLKPLPKPPAGVTWIRDETLMERWILVADTNVPAVPVTGSTCSGSEAPHEATTTTARMVPMETESSWYKKNEEDTKPMATVVATSPSQEQNRTEMVQDEEEGVAMLPQARMVADTTSVGVASQSANKDADDKSNDKKDDLLGCEYTEHVVLPTDTLAGICLLYKISRRELQRANRFYGGDLRLAPSKLYVPITEKARRLGWKPQDVESQEFKMAAFMAQFRSLSTMEAKCYLDTNDWDLEQALEEAQRDAKWERQEEERLRLFEQEQARLAEEAAAALKPTPQKKKSRRNGGPYAAEDGDEEDECLGCLKFFLPLRRAPSLLK